MVKSPRPCCRRLPPPQVVGVIGPSGCGKTSLLGSIAGSAVDVGARAITSGLVLVDGKR